ncbi:MAG TPA: immunoglobulin domain-containing protein [Chitinispirillaceae bacterium]|nr:immunoglobulin domain-containing protein [Chitinispirillaceae bacterium]
MRKLHCASMVLLINVLLLTTGCLNDPEDYEDSKPQILAEPQSVAAMFGDSTSFKVSVASGALIDYQWFRADTMIPYAKDSILVFAPVSYSDTGEYFVFISNKTGYVISQKVRLSVSGGEPVIAKLQTSYGLDYKDSIALTAKVAGLSPFYFQWYKEGKPISGAVGRSFSIPSFSSDDSGTYHVVVKNPLGADTSTTTRLYQAGTLFITQTDFKSGFMEQMSIKSSKITGGGISIFNDIAIRTFEGYIYLLERFGADGIIKYDPSKKTDDAYLYQKKLGTNWNPQDIEFVDERKAYVTSNNEPEIIVFDPSTGAFLKHIDISDYTYMPDSNKSPNANDLQLAESYLYVLLQRRDGFNPGAPSLILKVNIYTDSITDTIPLKFKNGYAMSYANGALYVTNPGSVYSGSDGGIEMVDLRTKEVTVLFEESTLGGSPNCIEHKEKDRFYITSYIDWGNVSVLEVDAATKTVVATLDGVKNAFGGIYYDSVSKKLFVGERDDVEMGVRIFENNVQVGATVRTAASLAPSGFAIVR